MNPLDFRYGFRVVGGPFEPRRVVDWQAAFSAYCLCDERADIEREAYLSAFLFDLEFREYLEKEGSEKGFSGPTWGRYVWFDIDRDDLDAALQDARGLVAFLIDRYGLGDDDLIIFFSGSKGFHVGLLVDLWNPAPGPVFYQTARVFAELIAGRRGVAIDVGIYTRTRLFRAPNSRHPKTGLFKRRLTYDSLIGLRIEAITKLAANPEPFDPPPPWEPPEPGGCNDTVRADWTEAARSVAERTEATREREAAGGATLNKSTLLFIRGESVPEPGDRHRIIFSAAANLGEFGCPPTLAAALLTDPGRDTGLPPSEVDRQIRCGLEHVGPVASPEAETAVTTPEPLLQATATAEPAASQATGARRYVKPWPRCGPVKPNR